MIERKFQITDSFGLHMRPAKEMCQKAMEFDSTILLRFRNREFNVKSLLSLLSACVQQGDEIQLVCSGPDEDAAMEAICAFMEQN